MSKIFDHITAKIITSELFSKSEGGKPSLIVPLSREFCCRSSRVIYALHVQRSSMKYPEADRKFEDVLLARRSTPGRKAGSAVTARRLLPPVQQAEISTGHGLPLAGIPGLHCSVRSTSRVCTYLKVVILMQESESDQFTDIRT